MENRSSSITAPAKSWTDALSFVAPAFSGRALGPAVACVAIDPRGASIAAFDYEVSAQTDIADVAASGEPFLVNYRWLVDAIRSTTVRNKTLPVAVSAGVVDKERFVTVEAGGYKLTRSGQAFEDHPGLPGFKALSTAKVDAKGFRSSIARMAPAVSVDDTLQILTGVKVEMLSDGLSFWATDRYRLATDVLPAVVKAKGEPSFLLKYRALDAISKKLNPGELSIEVSNDAVRFSSGAGVYTSLGIDGDYPKIASLFPESPAGAMEADRIGLLEAAKVAERMSERNTPCTLTLTHGGIRATFDDGLFGPSHTPLVVGEWAAGGAADDMAVAFNPRYLMEALRSFKGARVRLSYTSANKAWMLTGAADESGNVGTHRHLMMPVRLPGGYS